MKIFLITSAILLGFGFIFLNFTTAEKNSQPAANKGGFEIPSNIQGIIDNSCYDCHHTESNNEKGKKKLDFDKLSGLKTYKLVGKLADISDVVVEDDMPPAKAIKKYPELKLSDEEKATLSNWAKKTAEELSK
jgi:cytochrome c553